MRHRGIVGSSYCVVARFDTSCDPSRRNGDRGFGRASLLHRFAKLFFVGTRADTVVAQVQSAIAASAPGIGDFAKTGLPELARLGAEARGLVTSLNSLVRRIDRDPARFLLDDRVPEYRR